MQEEEEYDEYDDVVVELVDASVLMARSRKRRKGRGMGIFVTKRSQPDQRLIRSILQETPVTHPAQEVVDVMTDPCRRVFALAHSQLVKSYGVTIAPLDKRPVGVAELASHTAEVIQSIHEDQDVVVEVGHVGAITATSEHVENMAVWNGASFVTVSGAGTFKVHGISSKINGVPIVPVTVYKGQDVKWLCWIFVDGEYRLEECSWALEGRAEWKNGVVYTNYCRFDSIKIGEGTYPVMETPLVAPTEIAQVLQYRSVSDGIILHSGIVEYKVKYTRTIDLIVRGSSAYTSNGVRVMDVAIPPGVYEFSLPSYELVRARRDRTNGNSSATIRSLMGSASVMQVLKLLQLMGVYVCSTLEKQLLFTGQQVQCGLATALQPQSCPVEQTIALGQVPLLFRPYVLKYPHVSIRFVKKLLSMRGYVIVNDQVIQVQEFVPRPEPNRPQPNLPPNQRIRSEGLLYQFRDYVYTDHECKHEGFNTALRLVLSTAREARK